MKKLVLFLVLILIVPAIAYASPSAFSDDDPQFKVDMTGNGFTVYYSWPGQGSPRRCTVTVQVRYGALGKKSKSGTNDEEFRLEHEVHGTGSNGWAVFDSQTDLDSTGLLLAKIFNSSCR
jgi:hypothetical protein